MEDQNPEIPDLNFDFALQLPRLVLTSVIPDEAPDPLADMFAFQQGPAILLWPKDKPEPFKY